MFNTEEVTVVQLARCQYLGAPSCSIFSVIPQGLTPQLPVRKLKLITLVISGYLRFSVCWGTLMTVTDSPDLCNQAQVSPYSLAVQTGSKKLPRNPGSVSPGLWCYHFLACDL